MSNWAPYDPINWWGMVTGQLLVLSSGTQVMTWPPDGTRHADESGVYEESLNINLLTTSSVGLVIHLRKREWTGIVFAESFQFRCVDAIVLVEGSLWWTQCKTSASLPTLSGSR